MQTRSRDNQLIALAQIDREHWSLIAQEEEFSVAVSAGASRAELEVRLTQLIVSFKRHFNSEEALMQLNAFPGLEVHTDEHRDLIGQISGLRDDLGSGVVKLCDAILGFMRLWTEQHIAGPDRNFAQFLGER